MLRFIYTNVRSSAKIQSYFNFESTDVYFMYGQSNRVNDKTFPGMHWNARYSFRASPVKVIRYEITERETLYLANKVNWDVCTFV